MEEASLKNQTTKSLIWKLFERFGAKFIQFAVTIVLARILLPAEFGSIALLTAFIEIANVFVQTGFSSALIQKKEVDDLDYSTVFYVSLIISVVVYIIIVIIAGPIADYYKMPILKPVLIVLGIVVVVGSYNSIQITYLRRNLEFKKMFICSIIAVILSGIIGIVMAYLDFGIWALVGQQLSSAIISTIAMIFVVKWHPKLHFSSKKLKEIFSYGWKLLLSGLLDSIYNNLYTLIIGKKYTNDDLAYFNKAKQFPSLLVENINGSLIAVMFPVMSRIQEDIPRLKEVTRTSLKVSSYIVFPMMVGLAVCADPIIRIVLTDKWLDAVPFLQMWAVIFAFYPISSINLQVYNALGRSDIFLWLEIIKKIIGVIILFVTINFGLIWMMVGKIGATIVCILINAYPNKKVLGYGYLRQVLDLLPIVLISILMGLAVWGFSYINFNIYLKLLCEVVLGIVVYISLSLIFKIDSFKYILNTIKSKIKSKNAPTQDVCEREKLDNIVERSEDNREELL